MGKSIKRTAIAENIIHLRKSLKLNQEDMAEKLGISRNNYAKYETKITPPLSVLSKISDIFNVSVDDLMFDPSTIDYSKISKPGIKRVKFANYSNYNVSEQNEIFITDDEYDIILRLRDLSDNQRDIFVAQLKNAKDET